MAAGGREEEKGVKLNNNLPFSDLAETGLFLQVFNGIEDTATRLTHIKRKAAEEHFTPSIAEIVDEFARVEIDPKDQGVFKSGVAFGLMIVLQQKDNDDFRAFLRAKAAAARRREKTPEDLRTEEAIADFEKHRDPRRATRREKHEE